MNISKQDLYLSELFEFLKFPSISANAENKIDCRKTADWLKEQLLKAGMSDVLIKETKGNPIVFGQHIIDMSLPTVLIYGHYDVQPPDPVDLWITAPFEPQIRNEKIYARGACDDKGQVYMHVKAIQELISENKLHCNIKFIIEGEEEIGSENLDVFVLNNKELIKADVIMISDTGIISNDCPSITIGVRGLTYVEVEVMGPNRDLHSGLYGGAVPNPINVLCDMISQLKDSDNRIMIPGFYDDVEILTTDQRNEMGRVPFNIDEYKKALDLKDIMGEKGFSTIERTSIRPCLDVNGIWGGYIGEGAKTVIPSKASAKISMRLVPNQNPEKITELFTNYFLSLAPVSVSVKVKPHHGGIPVVVSTETVAYKAASIAFEKCWGKKPVPYYSGGSIPIVALFKKELGIDTLLMGFGLDEDAIHSPNESYGLFNFFKGIETIKAFYEEYGKLTVKN